MSQKALTGGAGVIERNHLRSDRPAVMSGHPRSIVTNIMKYRY
jgi:hypothetical protein